MEGLNVKDAIECAGCLNNIGNDEYVLALGQDWHKDCFRCSVCDALLSSWYFEKNGLLFCQPDYWARYGECCQQCTQVITGPVMAAGSHRFHPECFACGECGAPIEDSEPYALVERTRLYCGPCYALVAPAGAAHAIRVVCVPASAVRAAPCPRDPAALTVTQFDSSCGVVTLHLGDRILEINGAPPRPAAQPALLQLTIEHNPDTSRNKRITCTLPDKDKAIEPDKKPGLEQDGEKRERLFKRKGDDGGRSRVIKRKQTPSSPLLGDKERSSSMSKLLDVSEGLEEQDGVLCELSRARSFRAEPGPGPAQKVFRACDLIQGELLGAGFFGEVYKVTHRATGEVMVLKQLYRVDDDAQRNFLKEVAVLRSLSHPHVLQFVGVVYKDKRLHLVTEYVAGGTLHQLIQDTSIPLSWRERVRLARDVSCGVGYLHRRNVIHRDLNSHNCLVREDKTVIVADFGLARIVQRTASSTPQRAAQHGTLRRKRYTVVGNPYWMAPEMMNGKVYDEKVDVFSFGVVLCEIIGRVSADPDFLPRRSDFGLNEALFIEKFCRHTECPEPFYRVAFRACQLDPDARPPFEVIEIWLESLLMHLSRGPPGTGPSGPLLSDILQYGAGGGPHCGPTTPECALDCPPYHMWSQHGGDPGSCGSCGSWGSWGSAGRGVRRLPSRAGSGDAPPPQHKSLSSATTDSSTHRSDTRGRALGKCVSASHIGSRRGGGGGGGGAGAAPLSRSQHALAGAGGFIVRAVGDTINITKVDDISEWLDSPPPLKRASPDSNLNKLQEKSRRLGDCDPRAFLRNQSVEGLETSSKHDYRPQEYSDSSSDEDGDYINVNINSRMIDNVFKGDIKSNDNEVTLRNPECLGHERKIPEEDKRRYNIDYLTKNPIMAEGVKHVPKAAEQKEKTNFFSKKLLSPKLSRLFKPSDVDDKDKSKSKFFIRRPSSPVNVARSYRVRPLEGRSPGPGQPLTPQLKRHTPVDRLDPGRFSCRQPRTKFEPKTEPQFVDVGRNRIKAPLAVEKKIRTAQNKKETENVSQPFSTVKEKNKEDKVRREGISRSNYVSLANLKINGKKLDDDTGKGESVERFI